MFIGHDLEAFGQVPIDAFDNHWVVVVSQKNVAIDVQKIKSLPADAVEFAVLIKNNGVAEPVVQLYLHDGQRKVFGISMRDGFHGREAKHTTAHNQIYLKTIKTRVLSSRVGVNK